MTPLRFYKTGVMMALVHFVSPLIFRSIGASTGLAAVGSGKSRPFRNPSNLIRLEGQTNLMSHTLIRKNDALKCNFWPDGLNMIAGNCDSPNSPLGPELKIN